MTNALGVGLILFISRVVLLSGILMSVDVLQNAPITDLIVDWKAGNKSAFDELFTYCYQQFKHQVRRQKFKYQNSQQSVNFCIQTTTSIVHDAYLKLSQHQDPTVDDRKDLYLLIAQVVRSVIYDQYRKSTTQKRSGTIKENIQPVCPEPAHLHTQLMLAEKSLSTENSRCAQALNLNLFAALKPEEIAPLLGISVRTVHNDLKFAKAWFLDQLSSAS